MSEDFLHDMAVFVMRLVLFCSLSFVIAILCKPTNPIMKSVYRFIILLVILIPLMYRSLTIIEVASSSSMTYIMSYANNIGFALSMMIVAYSLLRTRYFQKIERAIFGLCCIIFGINLTAFVTAMT